MTLVELIVAMSVAAIMLFLINKIFNDTQRAVSRGIETSEATGGYRALAEQLERDTQQIAPGSFQMLGPGDGTDAAGDNHRVGVLTILIKEVPDVRMPDPSGDTGFVPENLRTDQLMFFRKANTSAYPGPPALDGTEILEQTVAGGTTTFTGDVRARSRYARVWYGHIDLTENDGTRNTAETLVDATGPYINGWNWVLGRQALLLMGPEYPVNGNTWGSTFNFNRVEGVTWDSGIAGIGMAMTPGLPPGDQEMYMGVSDASEFGLHSSEVWEDQAQPGEAVIGLDADPNFTNYPLHTGQSHSAYRDFVYAMTYGPERLRGNPQPQWPLESWQYSQSHPVLLPNVSDFQVHFAADANNDGEIDRDSDDDGRPNDTTYDADDPIVWYGSYDTSGAIILPDGGTFDLQGELPDGTTYSPYEAGPSLGGTNLSINADHAFVWRHDDGDPATSAWPYLIRIRYRAHDSEGELTSTVYDPVAGEDVAASGKWFEVIFRVPRPQ